MWATCTERPICSVDQLSQSEAHYRALLKVSKAALSHSSIEQVFEGLCRSLKKLLRFDCAALSVYDPDHDCLRIERLCGRYQKSAFHVGDLLSRKSSRSGKTFEHRSSFIRRDLARELRFVSEKQLLDEGYRSLCSVPLILRRNGIGVLMLVGRDRNQFSARDVRLIRELSIPVALAVAIRLPTCPIHANTRLVCPRCIGSKGGRTTVSKHHQELSTWGKKGGRGRRKELLRIIDSRGRQVQP